jgi:hypothetical protein
MSRLELMLYTDITPFLAISEIMIGTRGVHSEQWLCRHLLLLVTKVPTLRIYKIP